MKVLSLPSSGTRAPRGWVRTRRATQLTIVVALTGWIVGCGNTLYLVQVNRAERNFEEAERLGAREHAPYEYYSASARLAEARFQAAQAEYGPASRLCTEADDFAVKAVNISKQKRREQGAIE